MKCFDICKNNGQWGLITGAHRKVPRQWALGPAATTTQPPERGTKNTQRLKAMLIATPPQNDSPKQARAIGPELIRRCSARLTDPCH